MKKTLIISDLQLINRIEKDIKMNNTFRTNQDFIDFAVKRHTYSILMGIMGTANYRILFPMGSLRELILSELDDSNYGNILKCNLDCSVIDNIITFVKENKDKLLKQINETNFSSDAIRFFEKLVSLSDKEK